MTRDIIVKLRDMFAVAEFARQRSSLYRLVLICERAHLMRLRGATRQ